MNSNTSPDTWASRIQNIADALDIPATVVETTLATLGYKPESGLSMLEDDEVTKFGDFREAFKEAPLVKLRLAFKFAKGSKKAEDRQGVDPRTAKLQALGFKVRLQDADLATLVGLYDPSKPSDPVTNALKARFGEDPVIAFNEAGGVAVEATLGYLADREQGLPEQESIMVDGMLCRLLPLGIRPDVVFDEDPLFPGKPLRSGRSLVNHRNWTKVSQENRQLVRIIVERGEIDVQNQEAVIRLLERATADSSAVAGVLLDAGLKDAYPEAWLDFRERKKLGTLPKLKLTLEATKKNNPFGVNRKY